MRRPRPAELVVTYPIIDGEVSDLDMTVEALRDMSDRIAAAGYERMTATRCRIDRAAATVTAWCDVVAPESDIAA